MVRAVLEDATELVALVAFLTMIFVVANAFA